MRGLKQKHFSFTVLEVRNLESRCKAVLLFKCLRENPSLPPLASCGARCSLTCSCIALISLIFTWSSALHLHISLFFYQAFLSLDLRPFWISNHNLILTSFNHISKDLFSKGDQIYRFKSLDMDMSFWGPHSTCYILGASDLYNEKSIPSFLVWASSDLNPTHIHKSILVDLLKLE